MPSSFALSHPANLFQIWFVVYLYLSPFLLYAAWTSLSLMDLSRREESRRLGWGAFVVLVPWVGGAWYLLARARTANRSAATATVWIGLLLWLLPMVVGIWLAGGALGPKALN